MLGSAALLLVFADPQFPPARAWIDHLWFVVPAPTVTRWLLLLDAGCLVLIALRLHPRLVAVPTLLAGGFVVLNGFALALTDFFLALAGFHLGVAGATVVALRRHRWIGIAACVLVLTLGVIT